MTEQALEAMTRAEMVARNVAAVTTLPFKSWARDRLRLIARDRATLERHQDDGNGDCQNCGDLEWRVAWPCEETHVITGYWLNEETR